MKSTRNQKPATQEPRKPAQPQPEAPTTAPDTGLQGRAPEPAGLSEPARGSCGSLLVRWLISPTVRQAMQMRRHVWKLLQHQRDVLSAEAVEALQKSLDRVRSRCVTGNRADLEGSMEDLEKTATGHLKSYLFPSARENIEVLLVAIAVAMAIRTFFLQPFKIPTGSMQPTLWGITSNPDCEHDPGSYADQRPNPDFEIPNRLQRFVDYWWRGISIVHVVARTDGAIRAIAEPTHLLIFDLKQQFWLGDDPTPYTIWFPPDGLFRRAGLAGRNAAGGTGPPLSKVFKKGEDIIKLRCVSGDHLFVDRLTYNFRRPTRGEIVVFETRHIKHWMVPTDQFYIKRLVGLSDEALCINTNRHLVVNGKELTANTRRFENLYGYNPTYLPNHYFGHMASELFAGGATNVVPHDYYMVMGDNTMNSLDSRYWGGFPREDVIGKAWFVYWPIDSGSGGGHRFGWGYR